MNYLLELINSKYVDKIKFLGLEYSGPNTDLENFSKVFVPLSSCQSRRVPHMTPPFLNLNVNIGDLVI